MFFCVRGASSRAHRGLKMQRFGHVFGFFWIRDVLRSLVDVTWAITGPWKQWGLAKHIAKPSKLQKSKSPPFGELGNLLLFHFSPINHSKRFQIDLTLSIFTSTTNPFRL